MTSVPHSMTALPPIEAEGLVTRTVVPATPVQIRYRLTDRGRAFIAAAAPLVRWGMAASAGQQDQ